jgi:hypothetical protein
VTTRQRKLRQRYFALADRWREAMPLEDRKQLQTEMRRLVAEEEDQPPLEATSPSDG